jgi:hypothetical protein
LTSAAVVPIIGSTIMFAVQITINRNANTNPRRRGRGGV